MSDNSTEIEQLLRQVQAAEPVVREFGNLGAQVLRVGEGTPVVIARCLGTIIELQPAQIVGFVVVVIRRRLVGAEEEVDRLRHGASEDVFQLGERSPRRAVERPRRLGAVAVADEADDRFAAGDVALKHVDDFLIGQAERFLKDGRVAAFLQRHLDEEAIALQFAADGADEDAA